MVIGVDIGTTGVKAVLLDPDRGIVAQASRANILHSPAPGWAEADPGQWRANVLDVLADLVRAEPDAEVGAIATTGMVPAVVAVDEAGQAVRAAMLQNDARAGAEVRELTARLPNDDVLAATGSALSQQSVAPKALWLARNEEQTWGRTASVVGSYDWVLMALGAPVHVEANWALESGLFAITGELYAPVVDGVPGLLERVGPVRRPGEVVGALDASAAAETGLRAGTPLVVGGADHVLSAYSAGLTEPGDWLVKLGGAGDILAVAEHAVVDARFFLDAHPIDGLWLPNGCMATSGSLVRWVQALLRADDLAAMDAVATERTAAEILCLPYFLGEKSPRNDPDLRGVLAGLHLGHDAADVYRAALEGIAFGFRHNAEVLRGRGIRLERATVTNGGATSLLWKRIHASVLGVPLRTIRNHPGASLGAALAAGIGIGAFAGWREALALVKDGPTVEPDPALIERYDEAYALWCELGEATAGTMRALARR